MGYVPDQGDIVSLDFDPSSGKEIMKRRPAFVISRKIFNAHTGMAIVAPIASTIKGVRLEVVLPTGMLTIGSVLAYQLKSLDFRHCHVKFIENAPLETIRQVVSLVQVIIR
ncbi:MAG: PemK family transcriptional regulator [Gammaproteobacteria bacterium GWF2_41_13]|nr:MAG: PemK family transcriptional regulator [Gammaproteobacteria bacterium GWF2_41_13]